MSNYYVISASGDGDIYFKQYDETTFRKFLDNLSKGFTKPVFHSNPVRPQYLDHNEYIIIKGEIVVPQAAEKVIRYELP